MSELITFFERLIRITPLTGHLRKYQLIKNELNKGAQSEWVRNPFFAFVTLSKPVKSSLAERVRNDYDKIKKIREGGKKRMKPKYN